MPFARFRDEVLNFCCFFFRKASTTEQSEFCLISERSTCTARAAVYIENGGWQPADGGLSQVDVYLNATAGTYRVIAMDIQNQSVRRSRRFSSLFFVCTCLYVCFLRFFPFFLFLSPQNLVFFFALGGITKANTDQFKRLE